MAKPSTLRTSSNDPLRVDFLAADAVGLSGRIGLTIAPGKKDRARDWDRDLTADLARLRAAYEPALLVSLAGVDQAAFTISQGVEMGRPSILKAAARRTPDGVRATVGGGCAPMFRGEVTL